MTTLELTVQCPYCKPLGYAKVIGAQDAQGTVQIQGIKEPRRCVVCDKYFALQPRVVIDGVKLEEIEMTKKEIYHGR